MSIISASTTSTTAYKVTADTTGTLVLQTGASPTTAMTIDTSQNVGIGTTSPSDKLHVVANATGQDGAIRVDSQFGSGYFGAVGNYPAFGYRNGGVLTAALGYDTNSNFLFTGPASSRQPAFLCRAWVNFNGTGTVAIRASGNVSSITDNGTGDYTVNFTTALADANYAVVGTADTTSIVNRSVAVWSGTNQTASLVRIGTLATGGSAFDANYVELSVFR